METYLMQMKELFHLEDQDIRSYSPLTLAYIGDGVYELIIRTILVKKGNCPVNRLHKKASSLVKAAAQSAIIEKIEEELTGEGVTPILLQWQNMQQWQITEELQDLRLLWDICI